MKVSKIILGTGCYKKVKAGNTLSITGDGGIGWGYTGHAYLKLAPKLATYTPYAEGLEKLKELEYMNYVDYKREIEEKYIKSYYELRLKYLDVDLLLDTLNKRFGENIILLCHEPVSEFCHRRLVADYIELKTGEYIPEVKVNKKGKVKELKPIRYLDKLKEIMDNE